MSSSNIFSLSELGGLGLLGMLVYGGIKLVQLSGIAKKVDMSVKDLSEKTVVEVEQSIVDKAAGMAMEREIGRIVNQAGRSVTNHINYEVNTRVREEVNKQKNEIASKIVKKFSDEIAGFDKSEVTRRIERRAEELVVEKLDHATDAAMDEFNKKLKKMTKAMAKSTEAMVTCNKVISNPELVVKLN